MDGILPTQEQQIKELVASGNMIAAIKLYREMAGVPLKEAKDAVDLIQAEMRMDGYSSLPATPAFGADPFAEEGRETRRRLLISVALILLIAGGIALFFMLQSGV